MTLLLTTLTLSLTANLFTLYLLFTLSRQHTHLMQRHRTLLSYSNSRRVHGVNPSKETHDDDS